MASIAPTPAVPFYEINPADMDAGIAKKLGSNGTEVMAIYYGESHANSGDRVYWGSSVGRMSRPKEAPESYSTGNPETQSKTYRVYVSFSGSAPLLQLLRDCNASVNEWVLSMLETKAGLSKSKRNKLTIKPVFNSSEDRDELYISMKCSQLVMDDLLLQAEVATLEELPQFSYVRATFDPRSLYLNGPNAGVSLHADKIEFVKACEPSAKRARLNAFTPALIDPRFEVL
jgi:hypothetical protein